MTTTTLMPLPKQQYLSALGTPLVGGNLYTYAAGTTNPKATYTDAAGTVPQPNPIPLNARGEPASPIFWSGSYKVELRDALGNVIYTVDNYNADPYGVQSLRTDLAATTGPSLIGFILDSADAVAQTVLDKLRHIPVCLEDFKLVAEADWSNAANRACKYCFLTGATLQLKAQTYSGARIEVHGTFNVEGNGATVDFLGVGYTIIAGLGAGTLASPTAWGVDGAIYNAAAYAPTMYGITAAVAVGDDSISLSSVAGLSVGDVLFLAGNPSSASSVGNYIPTSFEYAQIQSIVGNVVTLNGKSRNTYTTSGAAFKTPGLAHGCRISDLRLKSTVAEAYQLTIRSALNVVIDNIEFAGRDTIGSETFSEGLQLRNFRANGAGGNWSFARGTVSAVLDGVLFQYRSGMASETNGIFVEESFYDISLRSVRCFGASFSVRQVDMTGTIIKRSITLLDSCFDTRVAPGGASSPFQVGNVAGADIESINCTFVGEVVVPNAGTYPGITGSALTWVASNQTGDRVKFSACHFKSTSAGASFKAGSGVLGQVLFDRLCTYDTCDEPVTAYTPRGAWVDMTGSLLNGYSIPAGSVAQYRVQDKQVYFKGRLNLNGAGAGSTFFTMPAGIRPLTEARDVAATDTAGVFATLRINTGGSFFYVGSNGAPTYIQLDGFDFPTDA